MRLPDGRRLTYEEFGDRDGLPLLFFHGTPSSSRIARLIDRAAAEARCRLIALNRPGLAGSSFQVGRRIADWPADVGLAAEQLGIPRFHVCGHSGGAPYALACAISLAERVAAVAVLGGALPQEVAAGAPLSPEARATLRQFERPRSRRRAIALSGWLASLLVPRRLVEHSAARLPPADLAFFRAPGVAEIFAEDLKAALQDGGRGAVHDHWLIGEPAGLELGAVRCPVSIWYGEDDRTAHPDFGPALASAIDRSELHLLPGVGHLSLLGDFGQVVRSLRQSASLDSGLRPVGSDPRPARSR